MTAGQPALTLSAITFDSETLAQKVIPFWKALEIGYLIVLKREKSEKNGVPRPRPY